MIAPVVAPTGTVATSLVSDSTVKLAAGAPPNETAVAVARSTPAIATVSPTGPHSGLKPSMVGVHPPVVVTSTVPPSPTTQPCLWSVTATSLSSIVLFEVCTLQVAPPSEVAMMVPA